MFLGARPLRIALAASGLLMALSLFAWIQAVRLPDYANYWEFSNGWHVGVQPGGWSFQPDPWQACVFVGQFPDRGSRLAPSPDLLTSPYRWPDLCARQLRIIWPLLASLIVPSLWISLKLLNKKELRGFPVGT